MHNETGKYNTIVTAYSHEECTSLILDLYLTGPALDKTPVVNILVLVRMFLSCIIKLMTQKLVTPKC